MKLLFIQGGSRWKLDREGNLYTDSNFNDDIWRRYRNYGDELTVVLRKEEMVYMPDEARKRFNAFDPSLAAACQLPDLYRPVQNVLNLRMRREIKKTIEREVQSADKIIIRSIGTYYTDTALKCARKYGKPHLVEVTGYSWESMWYHSLRGKLVAPFNELECRRLIRDVPWAVYVTGYSLQHRYPCKGRAIGCSDVELESVDEKVLNQRLERIRENRGRRLVLGTAAFLDVGWKGQEYVIRALSKLRRQGVDAFEYQLIGGGTGERLLKLAKQLGVSDRVHILEAKPHGEVFDWLDQIDIYVQSSFMEGLCRSIVEAMSRACPVIASNVGGNSELVSPKYLFPKGNATALSRLLLKMMAPEVRVAEAKRGFELSKEYQKENLDLKRDTFYRSFVDAE